MSISKVACESCGTLILKMTYELTEGYCMPCARSRHDAGFVVADYVKKRWPKPILSFSNPPSDVLLSVAYSPAWGDKSSSWIVQILDSGTLRQTVQRYPISRENIEEELEMVALHDDQMSFLRDLLGQAEQVDFSTLQSKICMEDGLDISLKGQASSFKVTLSACLHYAIKKGDVTLDDTESKSYKLFNNIYDFVTTHCKTD